MQRHSKTRTDHGLYPRMTESGPVAMALPF